MNYKKIAFIFSLVIVMAGMIYSSALAKKSPNARESVIWNISKPTLVSAGQTTVTEEGTLISGYTIQARVRAKQNNIVPDGTITITMSAFSPSHEMPGQIPGKWYIQGNWVIVKKNASKDSTETRHSIDRVEGNIKAELEFNPFASPVDWSGLAWVPMSPTAGRWSLGQGTVTLNEKLEGELVLDLTHRSDLHQ